MLRFLKRHRFVILSAVIVFAVVGTIEFLSGRSILGPDGHFAWWDNNIWGNETSQRVADVYSFSHIIHGMLFYGFLWLVARRVPVKYRFLIALVAEGGWELLENSSFIINRYRQVTIGVTYFGDSILNSVSDIAMMALGFFIARWSKVWIVIVLIIAMELGCLWWVRDNLTLNVIMLVHPVQAIKNWQSEGH
jgi:hypothetical protein